MLVIIGLIVGGVLVGRDLIRNAELRSVGNDFLRYQTAMITFQNKYNALPGDIRNAVRFWGALAGGTANGSNGTCANDRTIISPPLTCNGNGDGMLGQPLVSWGYAGVPANELYRFWQHLANAGLIEGNFSGYTGNIGGPLLSWYDSYVGVNVPQSRIKSAGYTAIWYGTGVNTMFTMNYGNVFFFGVKSTPGITNAAALTPLEAYNVDVKIDDGAPNNGKLLTYRNSGMPNCVPVSNDRYNTTYSQAACSLIFITGF